MSLFDSGQIKDLVEKTPESDPQESPCRKGPKLIHPYCYRQDLVRDWGWGLGLTWVVTVSTPATRVEVDPPRVGMG